MIDSSIFIQILGTSFLIFRVWIVEFKLVDELKFRRHYVSRILSYYLAIAMMVEFNYGIFNFAVLYGFPIILSSIFGWDLLFFIKFKRRTYWEKNHGWLIIERITLHFPLIAAQLWMVIRNPVNFISPENIVVEFICAIILTYLPWLLWDYRWNNKEFLPRERKSITTSVILCTIGWIIYFIIVL